MTRMTCLPWWHARFAPWSGKGRVIVKSGCATSGGRVMCDPAAMQAAAEAFLRVKGLWKGSRPLPLTAYTLARYTSSEVGSGTPEEKVAVAEAAVNRTRLEKLKDVNQLLLYRRVGSRGYGAYGPIHDPSMGAPFGRWASTSRDPGVDDLLIADFVLSGKAANFNRGGDDQYGPSVEGDVHHPKGWAAAGLARRADRRNYWVGPLPGVDHWKTFIFRHMPNVAPNTPLGKQLLARGVAALTDRRRPDWSQLPVCPRLDAWAVAAISASAAAALGTWLAMRT